MSETKTYWRATEELTNPALAEKLRKDEFANKIPTEEFFGNKQALETSNSSRRDFLKFVGFSTAAATVAACEAPVSHSIPYVVAPEEIIPGIADYYATTFFDGHDFASILIKTREGRPIKVENNREAGRYGGANARVHGSVLNLYDSTRLRRPYINGEAANWGDIDAGIQKRTGGRQADGGFDEHRHQPDDAKAHQQDERAPRDVRCFFVERQAGRAGSRHRQARFPHLQF